LELAELIFQRKVLPVPSDNPVFQLIKFSLSTHLEMMLRDITVKPLCDQAKDLLERVKVRTKKEYLETLARETQARRELEDKRYEERVAAQKSLQLKSGISSSVLKRKEQPKPQPTSNLFSPKKKIRTEEKGKEKDEKPHQVLGV
jgi:hypothetical protein